MNILIVKLSAVGDVIHTLPSLAALRKLYPKAHITWVIEEAAADLITDHPYLDRVVVSPRKTWGNDIKKGHVGKVVREGISFLKQLRERPYDLVIDFHGLFKSAVIVLAGGGKRKLGYDSMQELSGFFYSEKIPEDMGKHALDRYLDFPRHLAGGKTTPEAGRTAFTGIEEEFRIAVGEEHRTRVDELLQAHGIERQDRLVAVSPVALWETKLWEDEKFARLCDRIMEELKARVVLTGNDGEALVRIASRMENSPVNLGGKTTLRDLAYLYGRSAVLVTTDSGPMHLAAAVGTPVVALFGPTDPKRTGPSGKGHTVIRKELPCSPCFLKKCESTQCMRAITVEEVLQAVGKKLVL